MAKITKASENSQACSKVEDPKMFYHTSAVTNFEFKYIWKLNGFKDIPFISSYPIYSPSFMINDNSKSSWQIVMTKHMYSKEGAKDYENEEGDVSDEFDESGEYDQESSHKSSSKKKAKRVCLEKHKRIGLRLLKTLETHIWDTISYRFILKDKDDNVIKTDVKMEPGITGFCGLPVYSYIQEEDEKAVEFFNEEYIEVICEINYTYISGRAPESPVCYEGKEFTQDLKQLYLGESHCDILLKTKDGQQPAHRIVLDAALPGFRKYLNGDVKSESTFDLNLDSDVAKLLIKFMYSGQIEANCSLDNCVKLHEAGKKYGVDCLELYSSNYFKKNVPCTRCQQQFVGVSDCLASPLMPILFKGKSYEECNHKVPTKKVPTKKA